ncbi:von willebrand factor [Mycena sanguinolenta]|uniref:von willebrand factor n=1 Tax=Mycena sanguinolenta TaxID=230812 RepID=A0A8H7CT61_9AGAR|nr:von willebrand factor [Mycena sanguinolenta]
MGSKLSRSRSSRNKESALDLLRNFQTVLIVDDSRSMKGELWEQAGKALQDLAAVASEYDVDGLEIHFFNSNVVAKGIKTAEEVEDVFNKVTPTNSTPMGLKLHSLLEPYVAALKINSNLKHVNYIVITDGAPTDRPETEPEVVIVAAARELDSISAPLGQVGIQFVQVGGNRAATRYLESLDNNLRTKHNIRDMVDTTFAPVNKPLDMIKILTGGFNRRVDEHGSKGL